MNAILFDKSHIYLYFSMARVMRIVLFSLEYRIKYIMYATRSPLLICVLNCIWNWTGRRYDVYE